MPESKCIEGCNLLSNNDDVFAIGSPDELRGLCDSFRRYYTLEQDPNLSDDACPFAANAAALAIQTMEGDFEGGGFYAT